MRGRQIWPLVFILISFIAQTYAEPIKLHPTNSHYYLFHNQPLVLITSAEHYGAVINKNFDYSTYLEALRSHGLNYTRIYTGFFFEPTDKWIKGNTLAPKLEDLILPWVRNRGPGLAQRNRFDLDQWDPEYFKRLKDFVAKAATLDIVVEICFFNNQKHDCWPISPLYYKNNIQGEGQCDFKEAQTLLHPDLVKREDDYVRKITQEVNSFDNVILEVCDEPILNGTPAPMAGQWLLHLVELIKQTESKLPQKHLIAQQVEGPVGGPCDLSGDSDVSIIVAQYVWEDVGEQMGGMQALDVKYAYNKPIDMNETYYYPVWYKGDKVAASRVEAWEFIVGGGASFNQLNGLYTVRNPAGKTQDNAQILRALASLKDFIYGFDFIEMHPDKNLVVSGIPAGAYCRAISQTGQQYALYHHHSTGGRGAAYKVRPGRYVEKLVLNLPPGSYRVDWVEPASGSVVHTDTITHQGDTQTLTTPEHSVDIALRIKRL